MAKLYGQIVVVSEKGVGEADGAKELLIKE